METVSYFREGNREEMAENFNLTLESSDDEAPEEVNFEESKASALQSRKDALETSRREKDLLKERRRKRHELFQEQKKKRLLPVDILEEIDVVPPKNRPRRQDEKEKNEQEAGSPGDGGGGEGSGEDEVTAKKTEKGGNQTNARSLKGNYSVMRVKDRPSTSSQQKAAMDFIQSRLYGPGSQRTTTNELLSLEKKKGRNKGAAVGFVKKGWAAKHKEKAERSKQQWIRKQVPSI